MTVQRDMPRVARSPKMAGILLGNDLRDLRKARGLTLAQLAQVLEVAQSTVSRLEKAERKPDVNDVMDILDTLEVPKKDQADYIELARAARKRGWWQAPSAVSERQRAYAEMEAGVREIRQYSLSYLPGLLHTEAYARVRATSGPVYGDYDAGPVVSGRLARQQVILRDEDPANYSVLLDETALKRRTAPPAVLAGQLRHLVSVGDRANVSIRVLPDGGPVAMNSFVLYGFDAGAPAMVIIETATADIGPTDDTDIAHYTELFGSLASAALNQEESRQLIATLAESIAQEEGNS